MSRPTTRRTLALTLLAGLALGGCTSPLGPDPHRETFERAIRESVQREAGEAQRDSRTRMLEQTLVADQDLPITPEVRADLERMAGPDSYTIGRDEPLGTNLEGLPHRAVGVTLAQVLKTTLDNNLQVEFAQVQPAVEEAQLVQAQAAFDWVFYSNLDYQNIDAPRAVQAVGGNVFGTGADVRQETDWTAGIRRQLSTGGQFAIQQELIYSDNQTPNLSLFPNPSSQVNYTLQFDQPLLRNFGSDVALAQVRLAQNSERDSIASLKGDLITTITDAEATYWELVRLHRELQIRQRLLDRGIDMRDKLRQRFDVTPAQLFDAISRVERRRADILVTQNAVRENSDRLRVLMNDPAMPIGSEVVLLPLDTPLREPVDFNYAQAITTAVAHRPEVEQAVISLDNTGIRATVARNQLLPQLDFRLQTRLSALEDNAGDAYTEAFGGQFIDWLLGLSFELPIGNRAAEAGLRAAQLQRLQATIAYRQTIQSIIEEVRRALYNLNTNYQLIAQRRVERLAASESLRSLEVRTDKTGAYDPNTITNILHRQEQLALAEATEAQALTDYNIALARLHAALGLTLERNRVEFIVPTPAEAFDWPDR